MTGDTKERIMEAALFEAMYNELPPRKKKLAVFVLHDGETKSVVGKLSFIQQKNSLSYCNYC